MKFILASLLSITMATNMVIFDFSKNSSLTDWKVVDDVVMGGRSSGSFFINEAGYANFQGTVSLENNGGFSSVRYQFEALEMSDYSKFLIRLKGDGKKYQFRVKSLTQDRHSYVYNFQTNGKWQTIEIPLNDMEPSFRGMTLKMDNYPGERMEEVAFLIGNKKPESFDLQIDKIIAK